MALSPEARDYLDGLRDEHFRYELDLMMCGEPPPSAELLETLAWDCRAQSSGDLDLWDARLAFAGELEQQAEAMRGRGRKLRA